jgi:hypothetical protein
VRGVRRAPCSALVARALAFLRVAGSEDHEAGPHLEAAAGRDGGPEPRRGLGATSRGVHRTHLAVHDAAMERVLHVRAVVDGPREEALLVGFVLRKEPFACSSRNTNDVGMGAQTATQGASASTNRASQRSFAPSTASCPDATRLP